VLRSRGWLPLQAARQSQRAFWHDPGGAGRFWPGAASLVGHDGQASLPPRFWRGAKIGSVPMLPPGWNRVRHRRATRSKAEIASIRVAAMRSKGLGTGAARV